MSVRLTYRDGYRNHPTLEYAKDGVIQVTEIIEENNYYPFGLKHKGYNEYPDYSTTNKYKYAYGGKELNDELGLDLYDFGARNYDAAIGRWLNIDPLAENSRRWTPYNYAYNNPIYFVDPDGMQSWGFDSYGRDLVSVGAIASWYTGSAEAYWSLFIDEEFESPHSDDIIGTDGNAISYTLDKKNNITWSENTPKEFQDIANELILNSPSGKNELDEILYNSMYKYIVEIKEDLIEDKGGILHGKFVPNPDSIQPDDDTVYNANIILYKGGYNKIYHDQGGKNGTIGFLGYSYEGKYLSMNKLMASTLGHEFKHRFKANSRTLTPGMEYQFYEKNPNRFQLQILNEMYNKSMLNYKR